MDLSAIIVFILGSVLFFGFAGWMAAYSRKSDGNKLADNIQEIDFSKIGKQNDRFSRRQ